MIRFEGKFDNKHYRAKKRRSFLVVIALFFAVAAAFATLDVLVYSDEGDVGLAVGMFAAIHISLFGIAVGVLMMAQKEERFPVSLIIGDEMICARFESGEVRTFSRDEVRRLYDEGDFYLFDVRVRPSGGFTPVFACEKSALVEGSIVSLETLFEGKMSIKSKKKEQRL